MESKTDTVIPATSEPSEIAPVRVQPDGSAIRPHEEQTPLERVLRSHLWYPNDILARGAKELPKCVKAKEYRQAADWQELIRKAESDKKDWEYLLELYEQERQSQNAEVSDRRAHGNENTTGANGGSLH